MWVSKPTTNFAPCMPNKRSGQEGGGDEQDENTTEEVMEFVTCPPESVRQNRYRQYKAC